MACISYTWHSRGVGKWMNLWCYPARAVEALPPNPLKTCWILLQRTPNDIQHDLSWRELQIGLSFPQNQGAFFFGKFPLQISIPIFVLTILTWGFAHNQTWETWFNPTVFLKRSPKKGPFFEKMAKQHHHRPNPMRDAMLVHTSVLFPQFAKWVVQVFLWESYPPKRVEEGLTGASLYGTSHWSITLIPGV